MALVLIRTMIFSFIYYVVFTLHFVSGFDLQGSERV